MSSIAVRSTVAPRRMRLGALVLSLVAALAVSALGPAAVGAATAPAAHAQAPADNATKLKMVVIVGPAASSTSSFLAEAEGVAKLAESYGMDVRRVFHPRATAERVLEHIQGANIVAYYGHGNGWPSPYAPFQERTKNGFGLNPFDGSTSTAKHQYYGANWIRANVTLAPNAVVLLSHLCYAAGNGESGMAIPSWDVAHQRVDNHSAGLLAAGARAVFAYSRQNVGSVVTSLHTTNKTIDEIFMTTGSQAHPSYGFIGWNNKRLASIRMPGLQNHLDPHSSYGFYRAVSGDLSMTASEWSGSGAPPDAGPPAPLGPTVPEGLSATPGNNRVVQLSWQASTANMVGTLKYRVFRNGNAIGTQQTTLTYTDQPTKTGTFSYQVRSIDAAGNKSELAEAVTVQVVEQVGSSSPSPTPSPTPSPSTSPSPTSAPVIPSVPQGLTATARDKRVVSLSWQPSTSTASGTMKYRVFLNGSAIGTKQTALSYTDQRPSEGTFKYQVRAIDDAGNKSALSPAITVQVVNQTGAGGSASGPDVTAPGVPANVAFEALGYRYVKVTWQASSDDRPGAIQYRLFRNDKRIATLTDLTSYVDRPKVAGTHRYKVRAIDGAGNKSAFSPVTTGQAIKGPLP